jgi:hypothetical protein
MRQLTLVTPIPNQLAITHVETDRENALGGGVQRAHGVTS